MKPTNSNGSEIAAKKLKSVTSIRKDFEHICRAVRECFPWERTKIDDPRKRTGDTSPGNGRDAPKGDFAPAPAQLSVRSDVG